MTDAIARRIKVENAYVEPSTRTCWNCRHSYMWFSLHTGREAECGVDSRGRFPVHPEGTCKKFEERK